MKQSFLMFIVIVFTQVSFAKLPLTLPATPIGSGSARVTLTTTYYSARVDFMSGSMKVYTVTLLQSAPRASIPANLKMGTTTIIDGTLTMTLPSSRGPGQVVFSGNIADADGAPQPLTTVVGSWKLNQ